MVLVVEVLVGAPQVLRGDQEHQVKETMVVVEHLHMMVQAVAVAVQEQLAEMQVQIPQLEVQVMVVQDSHLQLQVLPLHMREVAEEHAGRLDPQGLEVQVAVVQEAGQEEQPQEALQVQRDLEVAAEQLLEVHQQLVTVVPEHQVVLALLL